MGRGVASWPPEVREEASFGEYEVRWRAVEGSVEVHNRLELRTTEVTPEDYPAFRAFLERYDAALRAPLAVEPKGGDSA